MKTNTTTDKVTTRYEWLNVMNAKQIREVAAKFIPAKYFDEYFTAETAPVEHLRGMLEDVIFENDLTPEDFNTNTTETMNKKKAIEIYNRVEAMNARGAWNKGVKTYALMLLNWYIDEASESPLTLETMLNGANNWGHYSRSGCGVAQCYSTNIAKTLCSPSELKRVKGGLKNPNRFEDWCDVEGRALFQAWQLLKRAENFVNCNA